MRGCTVYSVDWKYKVNVKLGNLGNMARVLPGYLSKWTTKNVVKGKYQWFTVPHKDFEIFSCCTKFIQIYSFPSLDNLVCCIQWNSQMYDIMCN